MNGPVFDFHARLAGGPQPLLRTMSACGISRTVVCAGGVLDTDRLSAQLVGGGGVTTPADNLGVRAACATAGDRLVPFWFASPYAGASVYRGQSAGFRGLELSPAVYGVGFADPRTVALVQVAADVGHPVYTVCVAQPGGRVGDLIALARRFPSVPFVFGHCGFTGLDTYALGRIAREPNLYAETSGCLSTVARVALDRLGPDRVLFGTEYPLQHPRVELAKYAALGLDAVTWRQVAWHNARRLLKEET